MKKPEIYAEAKIAVRKTIQVYDLWGLSKQDDLYRNISLDNKV